MAWDCKQIGTCRPIDVTAVRRTDYPETTVRSSTSAGFENKKRDSGGVRDVDGLVYGTHRSRRESVLLLAHSRIFFFSQPSTVFTHSSPGLRQSFDMNGISFARKTTRDHRARAHRSQTLLATKITAQRTSLFHGRRMFGRGTARLGSFRLLRGCDRPRMALFH